MDHVPHFLKKSSLYVLMMLSLSNPLYCDEISGTFKEVNINKSIGKDDGTVNFDMEAKLKLYTLMGEPVDTCHARWKPNWVQLKNQKSKIYTAKNVPAEVWNKIDIVDTDIAFPFSFANQSYNVHCNPGVFEPHNTQKFSMNTPGSTSWDRFFRYAGSDDYVSADTAKTMIKDTFIWKNIRLGDPHKPISGAITLGDTLHFRKFEINIAPLKEWIASQETKTENKPLVEYQSDIWDELDDKGAESAIRKKHQELIQSFRISQYPKCQQKLSTIQECISKAPCEAPKLPDTITAEECKSIPSPPYKVSLVLNCDSECHKRRDQEYNQQFALWKQRYSEKYWLCQSYFNSSKTIKKCVSEYTSKCNPANMTIDSCVENELKSSGPTYEDAKKLVREGWKKKASQPKPSSSQPTNFLD